MRFRGVVVLAGILVTVLVAGLVAGWALRRGRADTPEEVAAGYFAAWRDGDLDAMRRFVADPPAGFAAQHRALSRGLLVNAIRLEPRPVVRSGRDAARADFTVTRWLAGHGDWSFRSVLRLGRAGGRWRVLWSPATLYPGLKGEGRWALRQVRVPAVTLVARDGGALPDDGPLEPYLTGILDRLEDADDHVGWAVELRDGDGPPQRVKLLDVPKGKKIRTTLDRRVQAAADALGGLGAFIGRYPPGSTFKVVTAVAATPPTMTRRRPTRSDSGPKSRNPAAYPKPNTLTSQVSEAGATPQPDAASPSSGTIP